MSDKLTRLAELLEKRPSCGDNSCNFTRPKGGQHTNGGCRCASNPYVGIAARVFFADAPAMLRALNAATYLFAKEEISDLASNYMQYLDYKDAMEKLK